jgi:hypothetical protein
MTNDKTYDRRINIWINGKEVSNNIASIEKEMKKLRKEQSNMTIGSKEYVAAGAEIRKLKGILEEHNNSLRASTNSWSKIRDVVAGSILKITGLIGVVYGAFKSVKSIISTTEGINDRFEALTAGAKEMFWELQHSIATLSFNNLISGLSEAWKRGKQLNEELDRLADERAYNDYIISSLSRESRKLQEVTKNVQLDISVRSEAAKKREEIENKIYERSEKLANRTFKIEKDAWAGRNKMAAEEAVKLYEKFDNMNEMTITGLEERAKKGKEFIKDNVAFTTWMQQYGTQHSISPETINDYIKYFDLLEKGEAEVLPKLFNAFKNFDNSVADAQERLNTFVRESSGIFRKEGTATIGIQGDTSGLEDAVSGALMNSEYDPNDYANIKAELDAYLEYEQEANRERERNYQDTQDAISQSIVETADTTLIKLQEVKEQEMQDLTDKVERFKQYGIQIGSVLGEVIVSSKVTARDVAKELIRIAFAELKRLADIYILQMTVKNIALYGALFGGIRTAKNAALIHGAIALGEKAILSSFWTGGYSGPGGKYVPKGVVHGGEWVAKQEMVSSPVTGPIIEALEGYRVNNMPGYANGGSPDMKGSSSNTQAASLMISNNPKMERTLDYLLDVLIDLKQEGVSTRFNYLDIDKIRRGMDTLDEIKNKSSL